jgi:hypothetical protein
MMNFRPFRPFSASFHSIKNGIGSGFRIGGQGGQENRSC